MGIYLTAFACILQALTDKYLMTKIYSEPKVIGETLGNHMLANLTFFVFMFACGQGSFDIVLRDSLSGYSIIMLAVSGYIQLFNVSDSWLNIVDNLLDQSE